MAKQENCRRLFLLGQFSEEERWLRSRQEQVTSPDFLLRIAECVRKDFRRLCRANVRTREKQSRFRIECRHPARNLPRLFDPFLGQIPFRVGRTFRILAIDGDSVPHDIQLHNFLSTGRHEQPLKTSAFSLTAGFQLGTVNSSPAAGNKSSHEIPFQRAPRCEWRRADLPWRLRARANAGKPHLAGRKCGFSLPAAGASDRAPRQFSESPQASWRRVCPHLRGRNLRGDVPQAPTFYCGNEPPPPRWRGRGSAAPGCRRSVQDTPHVSDAPCG